METKELHHLEEEEKEKARGDAKRGLKYWQSSREKNVKELLHIIYGMERKPPEGFINTGNVEDILLNNSGRYIVVIFPFTDEKSLKRCYGLSSKRLAELISLKRVIPLIQPATRYEKLGHLHPILNAKPPDYFLRSVYFYSIFFDNSIDLVKAGRLYLSQSLFELYNKAKNKDILNKVVTDQLKSTREFYDQASFPTEKEKDTRIRENIWYRYASVASFIGEDFTDYILSSFPKQKDHKKALGLLLHLHFIYDHYWTQGLLSSHIHNGFGTHIRDSYSSLYKIKDWLSNILASCSRLVYLDLPMVVLRSPTLAQIEKATDLAPYDNIEKMLTKCITRDDIDNLRSHLAIAIEECKETVERICAEGEKVTKYRTIAAVLGGGIGSFIPLGTELRPITQLIGSIGGILLSEKSIQSFFQNLSQRFKALSIENNISYVENIWAPRALQIRRHERQIKGMAN